MHYVRGILLYLMVGVYVLLGINHFVHPDFYVAIMPPYVPWHLAMVYLSGAAEVGLGIALVPRKTRRLAGYGIVALLIAIFPANLHMALHPEQIPLDELPPQWALWLRLPLQLLLIAWAWWVTRDPSVRKGQDDRR